MNTSSTANTITFNLDPQDDVTCTFTNTQTSATIEVSKDFSDDASTEVTIHVDCTSGDVSADATAVDVGAQGGHTANFTVTGFNTTGTTCTATETTNLPGYSVNDSACAAMPISHDDNLQCTITNTLQTGTIILKKITAGGTGTFDFATTGAGLPEDPSITTDATFTRQVQYDNVPIGDKTITELTADGWSLLDGYGCVSANTTSTIGTPGSAMVSFTLAAGDTVTCTFTNTKNGTLTVDKNFSDASNGSVTITVSGCDVAENDKTATHTINAVFNVINLPATGSANCTATESATPGYSQAQSLCATVAVAAGGSESCTITNTLNSASFNVSKVYSPSGPVAPVNVTVTCQAGQVESNGLAVTPGPATSFTVNGIPSGGTSCTAAESPVPTGYTASGCTTPVPLSENGTAGCTITNTLQTGTITIEKDAGGSDQHFTFYTSLDLGTVTCSFEEGFSDHFTLDDDNEVQRPDHTECPGVPAGTYWFHEVPTAGWTLTGINCTGAVSVMYSADNTVNSYHTPFVSGQDTYVKVELGGGGTIHCTFVNTPPVVTSLFFDSEAGSGCSATRLIEKTAAAVSGIRNGCA